MASIWVRILVLFLARGGIEGLDGLWCFLGVFALVWPLYFSVGYVAKGFKKKQSWAKGARTVSQQGVGPGTLAAEQRIRIRT